MGNRFDSLINEAESIMEFLFFEEEIIKFDKSDQDLNLEPLIIGKEEVLNCKLRLGNKIFTIMDYKNHLKNNIKGSLREISDEINQVKSRRKYIEQILHRIDLSIEKFEVHNNVLAKNSLCKFLFTGPPIEAGYELSYEKAMEKEYFDIYHPFLIDQFDSLQLFSSEIKRLFLKDLRPDQRPYIPNLVFKYSGLYNNPKTSRDVKEYLNDLIYALYEKEIIKRKSLSSFLHFYGLSNTPSKIEWGKYIGDLNTFVKYHNREKLLSGHNMRTLPKYVKVEYSNWTQFHNTKATDNESFIIDKLTEFEQKLYELSLK